MLLCRIPAYVKSTLVGKLALNPIEKYSEEANGDWCHTNPSKFSSHPTTLMVIQYLISLETDSEMSYSADIEALKSIRISFDISRAKCLNEISMSIHRYLTLGGLLSEVLESHRVSRISLKCISGG